MQNEDVDLIPLMMEANYRPRGWLGLIMGTRLYYAFFEKELEEESAFEARVDSLVREVGDRGMRLAVEALLREGRIQEIPARPGGRPMYEIVTCHHDLYSEEDWEGRIDALYEHLEAVTETVRRRFLSDNPDEAGARTFTFRARKQDADLFREELLAFIRERTNELEANAAHDDEDSGIYTVYAGATLREDD